MNDRSENIEQFAAAFALAQGEFVNPKRNKTVSVRTKSGATYTFAYADLGAIIDAVRAPLAKNGLCFMQTLVLDETGKYRLRTEILHSSGQWKATAYPLVIEDAGSNQGFGSSLSYMRRYSLSTMLGIVADDDDDANIADGNTATDISKRTPKKPAPNVMPPQTAASPAEVGAPSGPPDGAPDIPERDDARRDPELLAPEERPASYYVERLEVAKEAGKKALNDEWMDIPTHIRGTDAMKAVGARCRKRAQEIDDAVKYLR